MRGAAVNLPRNRWTVRNEFSAGMGMRKFGLAKHVSPVASGKPSGKLTKNYGKTHYFYGHVQ